MIAAWPRSAALAVVIPLASCESPYITPEERIAGALRAYDEVQEDRRTPSHWIEVKNPGGLWEKVMVVMGFSDNAAACERLLPTLDALGQVREWRCTEI